MARVAIGQSHYHVDDYAPISPPLDVPRDVHGMNRPIPESEPKLFNSKRKGYASCRDVERSEE